MAASVVELTNGTSLGTPSAGLLDLYSNATKQFCTINDGAFVIADPVVRENETRAVQPQISGGLTAAPGGITNTSGLMLGLSNITAACIITPQVTGRVMVWVNGVIAQSTSGDGAFWHIRWGTGTAPSNAGALTGTQIGGQQSFTALTGVLKVPFAIQAYLTGATLGTAVWLDLVLAAVTGGTATMTQVQLNAFEL